MVSSSLHRLYMVIALVVSSCLVAVVMFEVTKASILPRFPYRIIHVDSSCGERPAVQELDRAAKSTYLTDDKIFRERELLLNMSHAADKELKEWLLPVNTGIIFTAYNETFRLGQGISYFHAMHCLLKLRQALQDQTDDGSGSSHTHGDPKGHSAEESSSQHNLHIPHCFSYIAQHVMCLGDSTIEPPWVHKDDAGNILELGVDGEMVPHKCKDTSQMWEVARRAQKETYEDWSWSEGDTTESVFENGGPAVAST